MSEQNHQEKWLKIYHQLAEKTGEAMQKLKQEAQPVMQKSMEKAKELLADAEDHTREELDKVSDYLARDLQSAAKYIVEGEKSLADWLRTDLLYLEDKTIEAFSNMVDQTAMELHTLKQNADQFGEWHTGEIAGIGVLECKSCGQLVHFNEAGHIPPCPKCHASTFKRPD